MKAKMLANPIRKVVTMMQGMQAKITEEGKVKEKMFEEFMCYCKNGDESLEDSIGAAKDKIPQLESAIKEQTGSKAQLEADVKAATADRKEAEATLEKAKSLRDKEASEYDKESSESKANIKACGEAVVAIEKGDAGAFLQTHTGVMQRLQSLSVSMDMESVDRDMLANFLSGTAAPGTQEILGILKEMHSEMKKDLAEMTAAEDASIKDYESLTSAKKKELAALTKAIETKTVRIGELSVSLAETSNDLEDTSKQLETDEEMLATLDTHCKTKKEEWEVYQKLMADEQVALADTIKLLNDDDALDLFKKTLPSASSFMQVQVTAKSMKQQALAVLKAAHKRHGRRDPRLQFIEVALHGGKVGFEKMTAMIDDLMATLGKEQEDDNDKKGYCLSELDKYEDLKKGWAVDESDLEKAIDSGEESLKALKKDIAALTTSIKKLDKSVGEATKTRKEENKKATEDLAANGATKELLEMAKNRLNKFYNPKLYEAPPKRALSEEDQITVNFGGTLAPTAAPGGISGTGIEAASFVQVERHRHRAHKAGPDLKFKKDDQASSGVIAMIDILISDVDKDTTEIETEEKDSQKDYEEFMAEAKKKRSEDAKAITDKEGATAETQAEVEKNKLELKDKKKETVETDKFIMGLHAECDFLLKYYDTRKGLRADELESLDKAKAVLNGADYSFLQLGSVARSVNLRGAY
jgi:chromosome segregation ATPase